MLDPADMLCYRFLQGYWEYGIFWRYGWTDGLAFAAEEGFRLTAPLTVYTVTLSWLSSWALIFWRPNKLYWRTVASCFWLEVVNSVCMLVVDTSDHWFTEIVSLNPLLKRCLGKAVHKVLHAIVLRYSLLVEVLAFPLGCCMFVVLFACGVFLCLFATALVVGTWSLIYYELALTFQSPRQMCKATALAHAAHLQQHAGKQLETDAIQAPARRRFDTVCSEVGASASNLLLPAFNRLKPAWCRLMSLDDQQLLTRILFEGAPFHPYSPQLTTFRSTIRELAGILATFLPLPRLEHLARPWRTQAFLPFLLTIPGTNLFLARPPKPQRTSSSSHEVSIFSNALKSLASTLDELRFDCNTSIRVVHAYLELEPAQSRAVEAEHQSHQAILDAVLDWKAQKLELERSEWRIKLA